MGAAVCEPGTRRCDEVDVQVCTPDAANWLTLESCMGACVDGACDGPSCLPFQLSVVPGTLKNDGISSALVLSDIILDLNGNPVPDGTLFTVNVVGVDLLARDGDPNTEGVQVRTLNGRLDFAVKSREVIVPIEISATHPIAGRCSGTTSLEYGETDNFHALDFTGRDGEDAANTTASWDTMLGRLDPFPSDFGQGQDGDLVTNNYNINQDAQPGRLFPDAVNFVVEGIGEASVTVRGGVGGVEIGDEVLLINLQGSPAASENVGHHEIKEVARINYGENTLFFTTRVEGLYGVGDVDNDDLTDQKIMLQRIPRYRSLRVNGTMNADAWDGEKGGVFFIKVLGSAEVLGSIEMNAKGYLGTDGSGHGGSYTGPAGPEQRANGGAPQFETNFFIGRGCNGSCDCNNSVYREGIPGVYATPVRQRAEFPRQYAMRDEGESGRIGQTYGTPDLTRWYLGSPGFSVNQTGNCCCNYRTSGGRSVTTGRGGGIISVWASGISVRGSIHANGTGTSVGSGSGGSVFLRSRSMNVGNGGVEAVSNEVGSMGRIRLDYFGLAGTTSPEHFAGFAGDTVAVTESLDRTERAITSATLRQVVSDERGGVIAYQVTNDGGDRWFDIQPGETVNFGLEESDLRLRVTFSNDNLQPLTLNGLVLQYTESLPEAP